MDPKDFIGIGGVPLVQALVALTKTTFPNIRDAYWPGIALAWGEVLNLVVAWLIHSNYAVAAFVGIITGLVAAGLFHYGKTTE